MTYPVLLPLALDLTNNRSPGNYTSTEDSKIPDSRVPTSQQVAYALEEDVSKYWRVAVPELCSES